MRDLIEQYIQQHHLCNSGTPVLLACSGGVDSMVLADVLQQLKIPVGIAHCNFQLRENESEEDETFVQSYAQKHALAFHSIKFDTIAYKKSSDVSTQMAARELRYAWFEKIRKENAYHAIATAHHLDDQIETVLLNISKGTGIAGLSAMQPKNGFVIRPMLEVSKQDIIQFAKEHQILFREDSSNASVNYQRNLIRNEVLPLLQQINPSLSNTMREFIHRMKDYELLTGEQLYALKKKCVIVKESLDEIKMGYIKNHPAGKTILYHLLQPYEFNTDQASQIFGHFKLQSKTQSGAQFYSPTHRLVADRNSVFIAPLKSSRTDYMLIDKIPDIIEFNDYKIKCSIVPQQELNIKTSARYAYFDLGEVELPLLIRYAKEGDYFYPLGLSKPKTPGKAGKKKLSKFFKDEKLHQLKKESIPLIFSGQRLMWVTGHRMDDRFRIKPHTNKILKMVLVDSGT